MTRRCSSPAVHGKRNINVSRSRLRRISDELANEVDLIEHHMIHGERNLLRFDALLAACRVSASTLHHALDETEMAAKADAEVPA